MNNIRSREINVQEILKAQQQAINEFVDAHEFFKEGCEASGNAAIWDAGTKDYKIIANNRDIVQDFSKPLIDATQNSLNACRALSDYNIDVLIKPSVVTNGGRQVDGAGNVDINKLIEDSGNAKAILKLCKSACDHLQLIFDKVRPLDEAEAKGRAIHVDALSQVIEVLGEDYDEVERMQTNFNRALFFLPTKQNGNLSEKLIEFSKDQNLFSEDTETTDATLLEVFWRVLESDMEEFGSALENDGWNNRSFEKLRKMNDVMRIMEELNKKFKTDTNELAFANQVEIRLIVLRASVKEKISNVGNHIDNVLDLFNAYRNLRDADGQGKNNCFCNAIIPQKEGDSDLYSVDSLRDMTGTKVGEGIAVDAIAGVSEMLGRPMILLEQSQENGDVVHIAYPFVNGNQQKCCWFGINAQQLQHNVDFIYIMDHSDEKNAQVINQQILAQLAKDLCLSIKDVEGLPVKSIIAYLLQNKNTIAMYYSGSAKGGHYQSYLTKEQYQRVTAKPAQQQLQALPAHQSQKYKLIATGRKNGFAVAQDKRNNKK